jgi:hypothetical protein
MKLLLKIKFMSMRGRTLGTCLPVLSLEYGSCSSYDGDEGTDMT